MAVSAAGTPNGDAEQTVLVGTAAIAFGLVVVPFALVAVALLSRRVDWPLQALYGMMLAVAVGLPLLILRNPLASLVAGYAAAAVVSLGLPPDDTRGLRPRVIGAVVVSAVTFAGMAVAFVPTAVLAPALPFSAAGIADLVGARD